jgi:hypothetical protein
MKTLSPETEALGCHVSLNQPAQPCALSKALPPPDFPTASHCGLRAICPILYSFRKFFKAESRRRSWKCPARPMPGPGAALRLCSKRIHMCEIRSMENPTGSVGIRPASHSLTAQLTKRLVLAKWQVISELEVIRAGLGTLGVSPPAARSIQVHGMAIL